MENRHVPDTFEIFKTISYRKVATNGYIKKNIEIFNEEFSKKALYMYLYEGIGNKTIDDKLTNNIRKNGYVTAVTLAFYNIETNGDARGSLMTLTKEKANQVIEDIVLNS